MAWGNLQLEIRLCTFGASTVLAVASCTWQDGSDAAGIVVLKSMYPHSTHSVPSQTWLDRAQTWGAQTRIAVQRDHTLS